MDAHTQLELWHLLIGAIVTGVGTWGVVWRTFIIPAQKRAEDYAAWKASVEARLGHGDDKMDRMCRDIAEIKETLKRLEIAFAGSVFKGVGDAHHG